MTTTTCTCDFCGRDLSNKDHGIVDWRVLVTKEAVRCITTASAPAPLPRDMHFCALPCLKNWINGPYVDATASSSDSRPAQSAHAARQ